MFYLHPEKNSHPDPDYLDSLWLDLLNIGFSVFLESYIGGFQILLQNVARSKK